MADRLDAVGGGLVVRSSPGTGAVVRGQIPVSRSDAIEELSAPSAE